MRLAIKSSLFVAMMAVVSTLAADCAQAQMRDAASKVRGGFDLYGGRRSYRSYSYAPRAVAPVVVAEQTVTTTTPCEAATADAGTTTTKPEVAKKPKSAKKPQTAKKPTKKPTPSTTEGGVAAAPRRSYRSYSYEGGSAYSGGYRSSSRGMARERFSFQAGRKIRGMGE
ncbi:MAG: hypothetical protein K2Y37_02070 [Pirellulales bacterium]|nr:hypothetical protein [Pirellulales bacterium]